MSQFVLPSASAALLIAGLAACVANTGPPGTAPGSDAPLARPLVASSTDTTRLQSSLIALADTAATRIVTEIAVERRTLDPVARMQLHNTRLALVSALTGIVTGPDPVDGLLDMLTHTTLVANAQRSVADGKPADSLDALFLKALERNEADAWKLAEQWLDAPTRAALRERIVGAGVARGAPGQVAYVKLSDLPRTGSASVAAGEGMLDSLRAATRQADQVRLLAERSLFLAQRMPLLLRWHADAYTYNMLALDESREFQRRIGELTEAASAASRTIETLPAAVSRERQVAFDDLFANVARERSATLVQVAEVIGKERKATLAETAATLDAQRAATRAAAAATLDAQRAAFFRDLAEMIGTTEERGSHLAVTALLVGIALIAVLLGGLLGMLLLYRRLLVKLKLERRPGA